MVVPSAGEIVLVPFPFSDLSASKLRPAVCLKHAGGNDRILCQITEQPIRRSFGDSLGLHRFRKGRAAGGQFRTARQAIHR